MIKAFLRRDEFFRKSLSLNFVREIGVHRDFISGIVWTRLEDGVAICPPEPLSLQPEDAQHLMDALWDVGIRPSEGSGSAGALAATQRHLEDMRTLVFKEVK